MPTTVLATRDGALDPADHPKLDSLRSRLANTPARVLLHLHGGLVDEAHGRAIALRLSGPAPAGLGLPADYEQIYVAWRTGPLETLGANWIDLFDNDRLYRALLKRLIGFVSDKLGVPGAAGRSVLATNGLTPRQIARTLERRPPGDPFADVNVSIERDTTSGRGPIVAPQSEDELTREFTYTAELDADFVASASAVAASLVTDDGTARSGATMVGDRVYGESIRKHLSPSVRAELVALAPSHEAARLAFSAAGVIALFAKHGAKIAVQVIGRFRTRRDHGFYATIVEELARELYGDLVGETIWSMIKKDAVDPFASPDGAGNLLIDALCENPLQRLTVSGHSAGAIWATALIEALAARQHSPRLDLVLLAPAVRCDYFARVICSAVDRVSLCRVFMMSDELERRDAVLGHDKGYIYPSSLLYLVSALFEDSTRSVVDAPLLGMQRFSGSNLSWLGDPSQRAAAKSAQAFLKAQSVVYSVANGGPGLSSHSERHGDFDSEWVTLSSVAEFLR